jgi:hypothetical protein
MADNKKSFVLYCDIIKTVEILPNETAGELFKHLLSYVNDEEPQTDNMLVKLAFEPIKQQLKRDLEKWEEIKVKRSEAGKRSAAKRNKNQQKQQVLTSVKSVEQTLTNPTVNDNVNVTVNVNVNDIEYIYSLYPSKCPVQNRSLGKTAKNKKQIEKHLKTKTKEELENIIVSYIEDCKNNKVYLKNFSSLLNNLPEVEKMIYFKIDFDKDGVYRELPEKDFNKKYSDHLDRVNTFPKPSYAKLIR